MKNMKRYLPGLFVTVIVLIPIVALVDLWLSKKIINVQRQQSSPVGVEFDVGTNPNDDGICIEIDAAPLWERGVFSGELDAHILNNSQLLVDGRRIQPNDIHFWHDMMEYIEYDHQGRPAGSRGGHRWLCFDGGLLSYGAHTLVLRTSSVGGSIVHEDIWTFETIAQIPSENPLPLPTLARLPTVTPTP
jgi:hypothetical protein